MGRKLYCQIVLLLSAASLFAQLPASAPSTQAVPGGNTAGDVRITSLGSGLELTIEQQLPLSRVTTALCKAQHLKCTGTEGLAGFSMPAMTVRGTVRQVVSKLLEGTNVNYSISRNGKDAPTEISFLGNAPRGVQVAPSPTAAVEEAPRPMPLHSVHYDPQTAAANRASQRAQGAETVPAEPGSGNEIQNTQQAIQEMFAGTNGAATEPAQFQPLPDSSGNPVPVDNTPATVQPFPDSNGNPIPTTPTQRTGPPFPPATPKPDAGSTPQ